MQRMPTLILATCVVLGGFCLVSGTCGYEGKGKPDPTASDLHMLWVALTVYAQDFDGSYPACETPAQLRKSLSDSVRDQTRFFARGTSEPHAVNPAISRHKVTDFKGREQSIVAFYARNPPDKDSWTAIFLDGHTVFHLKRTDLERFLRER
jgi:hypothetical protein